MKIIKIIEDENSGEVIIDNIRIGGFIYDEKCKKCNNFLVYYEKYDAFFCAYCNEWVESKCRDKECEFCKSRPEKPL